MLVLSGFLFLLAALEPVLAIVHELAHRRRSLGGNLHQVQSLFLGDVQTLRRGHNAQLFAVFADEADLLIPDLFIEFMLYLANNRRTSIRSIKKRECTMHPRNNTAPGMRKPWKQLLLTSLPRAGGEADAPSLLCFLRQYTRDTGGCQGLFHENIVEICPPAVVT
nr:MAG TPA: hypothetical protein [Caudoviricetes sp.]